MPFQRPAATFSAGYLSGCFAHQPCHGHTDSGDGVFVEVGRRDGHLLLLLVDVEGHGSAAAETLDLLESWLLHDPNCQDRSTPELLLTLHGMLLPHWAEGGKYAAAQVLRIDGQGSVEGCNAGLPHPHVGQAGAAWQPWSLPSGAPLGTPRPNPVYGPIGLSWSTGLQLVAFTDGVTEAGRHLVGQQFQQGALQTFFTGLIAGRTGPEILADLLVALERHTGSGWPEDDTTIVSLH